MTPQETQHMICRQLDDILSQVQRICYGSADIEMLENFSRYSEEFKAYLKNNTDNAMILERLQLIPLIDVKNYYNSAWWGSLFGIGDFIKEKVVVSKAIEDVKLAGDYYSSIQFLYKSQCI